MKTMVVTLSVKAEIEYDPMDTDTYDEKLNELINELEDMDLSVSVKSEEDPDEEEESFDTEEDLEDD
jgi:hypothetical protein